MRPQSTSYSSRVPPSARADLSHAFVEILNKPQSPRPLQAPSVHRRPQGPTAYRPVGAERRPSAARLLGPARGIGERSIRGTFQRKFNGLSGPTYMETGIGGKPVTHY